MEKEKKEIKSFDDFTNLYELSKTLRFELKPSPRTRELLGLDNKNRKEIFSADKYRVENYAIIKKYIDELHSKFIDEALKDKSIDISDFILKKETENEDENEQDDEETDNQKKTKEFDYRQKIAQFFSDISKKNDNFNEWVETKKDNKIEGKLFKKELVDILRQENKKELDVDIDVPVLFFNKDEKNKKRKLRDVFNSFKKDATNGKKKDGQDFTTYFTDSFHNNRKNYYKIDGKAGRITTRIIDENLKRYCNNIEKFKEIENIHPALASSFLVGWPEYIKEKKIAVDYENWQDIFSNNYKYFLQDDINLYNFITRKLNKNINESGYKNGYFSKLHKQVHGAVDKQKDEFLIDEENVIAFVRDFIEHSKEKLSFSQRLFKDFIEDKFSDKLKNIYLSRRAIETISSRSFISWHTFGGEILESLNDKNKKDNKKLPDFIDIETIKTVLENTKDSIKDLFKVKYFEQIDARDEKRSIEHECIGKLTEKISEGKHWKNFLAIIEFEFNLLVQKHNKFSEELKKETDYKKGDEKQIELLFNFAESANGIFRMTNYFALRKKGVMVEDKKYKDRDKIHELVESYLDGDEELSIKPCEISGRYNALRNFVSKKPWIIDKIRLYFDSPNFGNSWAQDYDNRGALIFRKSINDKNKEHIYYLGIVNKKLTKEDESVLLSDINDKNKAEHIIYHFQKTDFKNFPRMFINSTTDKDTKESVKAPDFLKFEKEYPEKAKIIWDNYQDYRKLNKKGKEQYIEDHKDFRVGLIDYFKLRAPIHHSLEQFKDKFDIIWKNSTEYKSLAEFYSDTANACYDLTVKLINFDKLNTLVNDEKIYLFQIYNKDFEIDNEIGVAKYGNTFKTKREKLAESGKEKGKENLETTFFKALFDFDDKGKLRSKDNIIYKLSGGAKMFYRPMSVGLEKKKIINKDGGSKDIIEHPRYSDDKYFLYPSIICNFTNKKQGYYIDENIKKMIAETVSDQDRFRIISLDRGEKHLAYYSVVDEKGKILEMESLNYIKRYDKEGNIILEKNKYYDKEGNYIEEEETFKDYQLLLDNKEVERMKSKKSWKRIEKIKDIKDGYLSMIVNKIAGLVINAIKEDKIPIVVLENLNLGMMHSRFKIEKQIYQRLEMRLAKKFNYLVDKNLNNFFNAWQLTPEIKTFADLDKKSQVGIMFYVNPGYTSITCPQCGFRNRKKRIKIDDILDDKAKFDIKIFFENGKYLFKYNDGYKDCEVFSNVRRIYWDNHADNGKGKLEEIKDVTEHLKKLFDEYHIINKDIDEQIQKMTFPNEIRKREFWARLLKYFYMILNIRNCINRKGVFNEETKKIEGKEIKDYIYCPHCYFDSEDKEKWNLLKNKIYRGNDNNLEFNGDANGAYNIARKGIIVINKIKEHYRKLDEWKEKYGIKNLPKNDKDKIEAGQYSLTLEKIKIKENGSKKEKGVPFYILRKDGEKIIDIDNSRKLRRYPDLFVSNKDWDEAITKWAKENGVE